MREYTTKHSLFLAAMVVLELGALRPLCFHPPPLNQSPAIYKSIAGSYSSFISSVGTARKLITISIWKTSCKRFLVG